MLSVVLDMTLVFPTQYHFSTVFFVCSNNDRPSAFEAPLSNHTQTPCTQVNFNFGRVLLVCVCVYDMV